MQPVVSKLIRLIDKYGWGPLFEEAIQRAANLDATTIAPIRSLADYIEYIDNLLTWIPTQHGSRMLIYEKIVAFYFILDQEPLYGLQSAVSPTSPETLTPLSGWMKEYANSWGQYMDSTDSAKEIPSFRDDPRFRWDDYMPPPSGYLTFNQFFARHTKPGVRPVAAPHNPRIVVAPADSTYAGTWSIDAEPSIETEEPGVETKGVRWPIAKLLGDSAHAASFSGGVFTHFFLNNFDYHRFHVPLGGELLETQIVEGQVRLDVSVRESGVDGKPVRVLNADDGVGYQFSQMRGVAILSTDVGLVACVPVGMAQVSSVVFTGEPGRVLQKGEELGYFQFGGSDLILVFQEQSKVRFLAQINEHYLQGAAIANIGA